MGRTPKCKWIEKVKKNRMDEMQMQWIVQFSHFTYHISDQTLWTLFLSKTVPKYHCGIQCAEMFVLCLRGINKLF
jgi:hypothetical protein